jgi:hypothetical protein
MRTVENAFTDIIEPRPTPRLRPVDISGGRVKELGLDSLG